LIILCVMLTYALSLRRPGAACLLLASAPVRLRLLLISFRHARRERKGSEKRKRRRKKEEEEKEQGGRRSLVVLPISMLYPARWRDHGGIDIICLVYLALLAFSRGITNKRRNSLFISLFGGSSAFDAACGVKYGRIQRLWLRMTLKMGGRH